MDNINQALMNAISSGNSMDEKEFFRICRHMEEECEDEHLDALCEAIRSNNKAIIKLFIKAGIDINQFSEGCDVLPLGCAVRHGDLEIIKLLVAAGANPNHGDDEGFDTPLHGACFHGQLDILKFFLEEADGYLYLHDNDGETLLSAASGDLDTVRYLIEKAGFDPHDGSNCYVQPKNPLASAFEYDDNGDVIDYLIEDLNFDINWQDEDGKTLLMLAVENDYIFGTDENGTDVKIKMVKNIIAYKADTKIRNKDGQTACIIARKILENTLEEELEVEAGEITDKMLEEYIIKHPGRGDYIQRRRKVCGILEDVTPEEYQLN